MDILDFYSTVIENSISYWVMATSIFTAIFALFLEINFADKRDSPQIIKINLYACSWSSTLHSKPNS